MGPFGDGFGRRVGHAGVGLNPLAASPLEAAAEIGRDYEASLEHDSRRRGAHYTPLAVAIELTNLALSEWGASADRVPRIVDPTSGGGVFVLAALDALVSIGVPPGIALKSVRGSDVDPGAVDASNRAVAMWAEPHGVEPLAPVVSLADCFDVLGSSFDVVVGNPPFRAQLRSDTAHDAAERAELRRRFGAISNGYVDLATLVLVAAIDSLADEGVCMLIQPRSFIAARHGEAARRRIEEIADLRSLWTSRVRVFAAQVEVCAPVLVRRSNTTQTWAKIDWASRLAEADGVPVAPPVPGDGSTVGDVAEVIAGFRDHYYALAEHVTEDDQEPLASGVAKIITAGLIAPGATGWGRRSARFAKASWARPVVDTSAVTSSSPRLAGWIEQMRRPKVMVATQTHIVEAVADSEGACVPVTPVVAVVPKEYAPALLAAALTAPCVSVWLRHRLAGTGLSCDTIRVDSGSIASIPLPEDADRWLAAAALLSAGPSDAGQWHRFGIEIDAAYGLAGPWLDWWLPLVVAAAV